MAAKKRAAKKPKLSQYEKSVIETRALRDFVPKDMRPLFDHLIALAADSHRAGYAKRSGRELAHARKLARDPERYQVQFRSREQAERSKAAGRDDWSTLSEIYRVKANAEEHADRIRRSEPGMQAHVVAVHSA